MRRVLVVTLAMLAPLAPCTLVAQRGEQSVPIELVVGLLAISSGSDGRLGLVVGSPPPGTPHGLLTVGARVVGGSQRGATGEARGTVVLAFDTDSVVSAQQKIVDALTAGGYQAPPIVSGGRGSGGGFVSTAIGPSFSMLCGGDTLVTMIASNGVRRGALVAVSFAANSPSCDTKRMESFAAGPRDMIEMPTLRPPPGSRSDGAGSCGGGDTRSSTMSIVTSMPAAELHAYFLTQIRDQGWTVGATQADSLGIVAFARRVDDNGRRITATLGVQSGNSPDGRQVWVLVTGPSRSRR